MEAVNGKYIFGVVKVGERGQIVIPKEARELYEIKAGDSLIANEEHQVYGLFIEMDGKGVATPMQFYLTDSTKNFVRGALYFNFQPDNDSMQPVINFIRKDIDHMINTFEWK